MDTKIDTGIVYFSDPGTFKEFVCYLLHCQSVWGANRPASWGRGLGEQEGGGMRVEGFWFAVVVDLMISLREPVRVSQFAKRSRSRIVRSFVRSVSPVSVSGSGESHHGMHPLHGSQLSQSDSVLPETQRNLLRRVSGESNGESNHGMCLCTVLLTLSQSDSDSQRILELKSVISCWLYPERWVNIVNFIN